MADDINRTFSSCAAGLDIFEGEPKLNPEYAGLKNTFLLPHIGAATVASRTLMGMVAFDNINDVLTVGEQFRGRKLIVNLKECALGAQIHYAVEEESRC